ENPILVAEKTVQAPYSKSGSGDALAATFKYLDLPLNQQEDNAGWVSTKSTGEGVVSTARPIHPALVPNVVDMGLKDALYLLESKGFKVETDGRGTVQQQSVLPGSNIRKGSVVKLNMSLKEG
ncbi:MAG: PASTA domain-containing protein, partial [Bacteroidia bacterium]